MPVCGGASVLSPFRTVIIIYPYCKMPRLKRILGVRILPFNALFLAALYKTMPLFRYFYHY